MSLHLALDDVRRLNAAVEALLSPQAGPSPDRWWRDAERRLRALFPGASAMLTVPDGALARVWSESLDAAALRLFGEYIPADARTGQIRNVDASIEAWHAQRRRRREEVWHERGTLHAMTALGYDAERSAFYNEALLGARMHASFGLATVVPGGELFLTLGYARPGDSRFGADDASVCALLLPAFRAAHHALVTFGARHAALAATVDAGPEALLVVAADGRELHRSAALRRALAGEPEHERVLAAMRAVAADVAALRATGTASRRPPTPARTVDTALGRWSIRAAFAPPRLWGADDVVQVTLDAVDAGPPSRVASAASPSALTPRETDVARLLARRATNAEIAAALGLSEHTARRHTERVLTKLGVRSRREVRL